MTNEYSNGEAVSLDIFWIAEIKRAHISEP